MLNQLLCYFCISSILFHCLALLAARRFFSKPTLIKVLNAPPISILKPVAGLDKESYRNFASFCEQNYNQYQIIFGVTENKDPAIPMIQQIIEDYPHLDILLVISEKNNALNPKISNLLGMQPYIKHSLILISDSDIHVDAEYLTEMVTPLMKNPKVGAVTSIYRSSGHGFFNILESIETSTDYIPGILTGALLTGPKWTLGCSILLAQTTLESIGGFQVIQDHIGEDCLLGKLLVDQGYSIALTRCIIYHYLQPNSFLDYIHRKNRWNKGILTYYKVAYCGCLFTFAPTISSFTFFFPMEHSISLLILTISAWFTRLSMGWIIGVNYLKDSTTKRFFPLIPLYDSLNIFLWFYGFISKKIYWRHVSFKIGKKGQLTPL